MIIHREKQNKTKRANEPNELIISLSSFLEMKKGGCVVMNQLRRTL